MDDTDARIAKGKVSVLSNPAVIARRKRMEIRKFKKLAGASKLLHHDPLSFENSAISLKRARIGQAGIEVNIYPDDNLKITAHPLSLDAEAAIQFDLIYPPGASILHHNGLLRYKSHTSTSTCTYKAQHPIHPDTDADIRHIVKREKQLLSRISDKQVAGSSSLNPSCKSLQIVPPVMVHVSMQLEIESSKVGFEDSYSTGTSPGRGSSENVTAFSGSCACEGVVLSAPQNTDSSSRAASDGNFPPCGKLLVCGRRREMEDTVTIVPSFAQIHCNTSWNCLCNGKMEDKPVCDLHFFAVYDGHGGAQASNFCMEKLHLVLAEELLSLSLEGNGKPCEGSSLSSMWERAMTLCFSKVDREVGGVCPIGQCEDVDSDATCCSGSIAPENVGTTAVVTVVSSCQIVVANCGDSRAVLSRGGKAIPLSRDHKPDRDDEYDRIEAAGGRVIYWDGHRVGGLLALSRAIGDRYLKRYVVSQPEVTCLQRTEEDECLILASDGLWDVISNDTACEIARKCLDSSKKKRTSGIFALGEDPACAAVAALLVKLAYGRGSKDNISVVVIDLKA